MESSQQFHLKWNNHSLNTLSSFQQLLDTNTLVDVTLTCSNGKTVTAHRMVLAACSEYFYRLFKELPEKHPVIVFKDAGEEIVRDLLLFMYKGEVEVQESYLNDFLKFADTLQVKGLSQSDREEAAARSASEHRNSNDTPAVAKFEAQTSPIKSNGPLTMSGASVGAPPPPPAHSLPDMAKSYLAAAGLASGKFPSIFPLPNEPASAADLISQFSSPNLYRALHRKYQSIGGGPKFPDHDNPMLKQMPFLKQMFRDHPMGDLSGSGHPLFPPHAHHSLGKDDDSDGIAERSPPPSGTTGSGPNQDENGLSDNNGPSPMEGDFNTPPPGGESRSNTPGSNHNMDDLQSQRGRGGGKSSSGRGSRLERMIAAEYKILNEFSDSAPEALPVMTPELMKSRRTHSLQLAIGEILHNRASVQSAATKYHIPRETLRRHYQRYLKAMGIQKPPPTVGSGSSTVRSSVPTNNNAKTPSSVHLPLDAQGMPPTINVPTSAGDDSNGFSSLMDIGAAYGIWNPDVDGNEFKYKFKDLEARRAAIEAATASAAAHAAAMAAATSGSDNELRGEKEEKEKDLIIDEDDDDEDEPNPGSPEPPPTLEEENENKFSECKHSYN
eukprot:snap_masked-scaffold676_size113663-processed-gene-0.3 protein:Tk06492 transcript:snap_masked-scaffold676_size113663-processed-gene-0.3-mRNA-1 annotation:"GD25965"